MKKLACALFSLGYFVSMFSMDQVITTDKIGEMSEQEIQRRRTAMQKRTVTRQAVEVLGLKTPRSGYQAALKATHAKLIEHDEESLDQQLTTRSITSDSSPLPLTTDKLTAKQLSELLKEASDKDTEIKRSVAGKKRIKNAVSSVLLIIVGTLSMGTQAYSLAENIKGMDNTHMHQTKNMTMTNSNSYKSETLLADLFNFLAPLTAIGSGVVGLVVAWRNPEAKAVEEENKSNDLHQALILRMAEQTDMLVKLNQKKCDENRALTSRLTTSPGFAFNAVKFSTQPLTANIPRAISSSPELDDMEKGKLSGTGSSTTQPSRDLRSSPAAIAALSVIAAAPAPSTSSSSSPSSTIASTSSSGNSSSGSNNSGSSDSSGSSGS